MKRLILPLMLALIACGGNGILGPTSTPLSPPTVESAPQTQSPLEPVPATDQSAPTEVIQADNFPDANNFTWQPIASGLDRPVDIQSAFDGSGRLFIVEKYGVIRIYKDGQLYNQPFLNIADRVNDDTIAVAPFSSASLPKNVPHSHTETDTCGNVSARLSASGPSRYINGRI